MIDAVVVEADGGSRGNPGPAGYGAVVLEPGTGAVLAERSEALGVQTNNVAEYRGLIAGLEAARDLGARRVAVRMDSKLVVEQMRGTWQIKNDALRALARRAVELRGGFAEVSFEWIPRARNAHADRLANEAMDRAAGRAPAPRREAAGPRSAPRRPRTGHRPRPGRRRRGPAPGWCWSATARPRTRPSGASPVATPRRSTPPAGRRPRRWPPARSARSAR